MYVSIDLVEEVIERQLRKYKNKIVDKQQAAANFQKEYIDKDYEEEDEVKIIRTKKFGINVSGGCMCTDGTSGTQLLCILQCRDRSGECGLQT